MTHEEIIDLFLLSSHNVATTIEFFVHFPTIALLNFPKVRKQWFRREHFEKDAGYSMENNTFFHAIRSRQNMGLKPSVFRFGSTQTFQGLLGLPACLFLR